MPASYLFQELTEEELRTIVGAHFNRAFSAKLLQGGLFNTTYLITLENGERYVLRLGPINRHLLLPFEHTLMQGEGFFYHLAHQANVPASEVVACDTSKKLLDRDYMIVRFIESMPMTDERLPKDANPTLYRQTGELLARLHSLTGPCFGRLSQIAVGGGFNSWSQWIMRAVYDWNVACASAGLLETEERQELISIFRQHLPLFEQITEPHLVHADLWEGNVLVRQDEESWKVVAIIDGDRAVFGDIDFELASGWMINDDFMAGYGTPMADDPDSLRRRMLYKLLLEMNNYYIFRMQFDAPKATERYLETVRKLAAQLKN